MSTQTHSFPLLFFSSFLSPQKSARTGVGQSVGKPQSGGVAVYLSNSGCYHLRKLVPVLGALKGVSNLLYRDIKSTVIFGTGRMLSSPVDQARGELAPSTKLATSILQCVGNSKMGFNDGVNSR